MDNAINKKAFGLKIKKSRENLKLTQFQLAEKIGVSQNFLGDIERGIKLPSLAKLIQLSNELKISLDSLFADSLNNTICEEEEIYFSDKQLATFKQIVKIIKDNFDN
ncbi:MAG: helix-turn-helix transcriptional regulator [Clostridia bacterium]